MEQSRYCTIYRSHIQVQQGRFQTERNSDTLGIRHLNYPQRECTEFEESLLSVLNHTIEGSEW